MTQIIELRSGLLGSCTYSRVALPSVEISTFEPSPPPNGDIATTISPTSLPFSSIGWQRKNALPDALG